MQLINYVTEFLYAGVGALFGYLLMKMDDLLNNKQYTTKEYSKFTLGCYLATLVGLLLMRFAGPIKLPSTEPGITANVPTLQMPVKQPTIPSNGTAFFQPANNMQSLRFASGTPTF